MIFWLFRKFNFTRHFTQFAYFLSQANVSRVKNAGWCWISFSLPHWAKINWRGWNLFRIKFARPKFLKRLNYWDILFWFRALWGSILKNNSEWIFLSGKHSSLLGNILFEKLQTWDNRKKKITKDFFSSRIEILSLNFFSFFFLFTKHFSEVNFEQKGFFFNFDH